jgi:hypothetical protein
MKTNIAFLDQRISSVWALLFVAFLAVLVSWFTIVQAREVMVQFKEISNQYEENISEITTR